MRIVAATNRNLLDEVAAGRFREDLYYRLNVVSIQVPSLQERSEDIPLLAEHFLKVFGERNRKDVKGFTPKAMDMLIKYPWPGNVRELENAVERAVVLLFGSYVSERELPLAVTQAYEQEDDTEPSALSVPLEGATLEDVEREAILRMLDSVGDNKSEAAKRLAFPQDPAYQAQTVRAGAGLITPGAPCCAARRRSGAVPYSRVRSNTVR